MPHDEQPKASVLSPIAAGADARPRVCCAYTLAERTDTP